MVGYSSACVAAKSVRWQLPVCTESSTRHHEHVVTYDTPLLSRAGYPTAVETTDSLSPVSLERLERLPYGREREDLLYR
eukprot:scaffold22078_cov47-Attheya_sp.AAC.1